MVSLAPSYWNCALHQSCLVGQLRVYLCRSVEAEANLKSEIVLDEKLLASFGSRLHLVRVDCIYARLSTAIECIRA